METVKAVRTLCALARWRGRESGIETWEIWSAVWGRINNISILVFSPCSRPNFIKRHTIRGALSFVTVEPSHRPPKENHTYDIKRGMNASIFS